MKQHYTRRADGRYVKAVVDRRTGKKIYFYGKTERELTHKLLEYTERAECGRTFAEVADEWWGEAYEIISPTSVRGYRVAKERAVEEFGDSYIKDITARDITAFLRRLAAKDLAKSTVKNHKIIINRIFNYAVREGDVKYTPTQGVEIPRGLKQKRRTSATVEDEATIKRTANIWIMPYMALMTGLRKGELLALQWKDIDFENNIITVTKSLYYEGSAHIKTPKTESGNRIVPLLAPLKEELAPKIGAPENFILSDDGKKPLSQKRFRTLLKHYSEATGITSTMHQLRKSFATVAVKAGVPPKTLQAILGHKNISTTLDIYTEVRKESIDSAAEILNLEFGK